MTVQGPYLNGHPRECRRVGTTQPKWGVTPIPAYLAGRRQT